MQSMSISENIRVRREAVGISQSELARQVGVTAQTVQQWESGQTSPRRHRVQSIAIALGTTPQHLEHGDPDPNAIAPAMDNTTPVPGTVGGKVPLISWVQAGDWIEAIDTFHPGDAEDWLPCPKRHGSRTYALRVSGDSMTSPHGKSYPAGCVIFVDPDQVGGITNGDRVIAKLNGHDEVTFKQYVEDSGRRFLRALNPGWPPIDGEFRVLGKVIGKWEDE